MDKSGWTYPPALSPGDRIWVVAPSGPFDRTLALRGMAWLRQRYRLVFDPSLLAAHQRYAGSDERRRAELQSAISDPCAKAIVSVRGGYGLTRILPSIELTPLLQHPKWVVGFSDITALHVECTRLRIASLHAHNVAGLGRSDTVARRDWQQALENPLHPRMHSELQAWYPGSAHGRLVGGNLTLLFTAAAAGRLRLPVGAILAIEDVTEQTYRIDRMMTALLTSGALNGIAAVVVGQFTDCPTGRYGASAEEVLRERLAVLNVPVVARVPFGHDLPNHPLHLGLPAMVDATRGQFTVPYLGGCP